MTYEKRTLHELVNNEEPAWPLVQEWVSKASRTVEVLPPSESAGKSLVTMQVTTRSPMGAIIFHSGGLLVDHGWLRILGSGHPKLPRPLPEWNFACGLVQTETPPAWLLIADDVLGGFFALNGGRFSPDGHTVWYFAPDTLEWEDLERGFTDFLSWCFSGDVEKFYAEYRWSGWESEVSALDGSEGLHVYPPLCSEGPAIAERSRKAVPISELFLQNVGAV